ncbi:MAG: hypothetical protein M5R36_15665 [Deltaproteobacteria bacterium]|nr:hypothetical protein [Deltaproteobacteria bacterium]
MFREILDKVRSGAVGFSIDEVMTGTHEFEPGAGPEGVLPMEFRVTWGTERLGSWLNPRDENFMRSPLRGTVTIEGLCRDASCEGTLELAYFTRRRIRYAFTFKAKDTLYRYVGEKVNIRPWNLPTSHTTCYGRLTEETTGKLVSTSVTHFRLRSAPAFLASLRLA